GRRNSGKLSLKQNGTTIFELLGECQCINRIRPQIAKWSVKLHKILWSERPENGLRNREKQASKSQPVATRTKRESTKLEGVCHAAPNSRESDRRFPHGHGIF